MTDEIRRAIALVDGEHYPEVTFDALERLEADGYRVVAVVFLGGIEKLKKGYSFSFRDVPVFSGRMEDALRQALSSHPAQAVVDLSDEPVVGYRERFGLASVALASGASYVGSDFHFDPPSLPYLCEKPAIGIWGTGKRVGKTAVSGCAARHLEAKGSRPCVCTMGRGGPPEPELLGSPGEVSDAYLRGRAEAGSHAASDHFEDAMMGGVTAVGCRRCGGGMAGMPFYSNVPEGARLACGLDAGVVVFEGSGAAIPPVGCDSVMLVASAAQPHDYVLGYLGPYRLLRSDLVVVTMCEEFLVSRESLRRLIDGILSINPGVRVLKTVFRPRPAGEVEGRKIFLASTAPQRVVDIQAEHLAGEYGAIVVGASPNLADREKLEKDLEEAGEAEILVTELKAAGVDTVSVLADFRGQGVAYVENLPVPLEGSFEEEVDRLERLARRRNEERSV